MWQQRMCTAVFAEKLSSLLSLIIGVLGKRCEGGLKNGIKRNLLKYLNMWVMLLWGHSLRIIKCDWGKFFPKIVKWLTPTVLRTKKATYSKSSLKLWIERKYATELIPLKSYKKGLAFLVTLKYFRNHSLKLVKVFSQ